MNRIKKLAEKLCSSYTIDIADSVAIISKEGYQYKLVLEKDGIIYKTFPSGKKAEIGYDAYNGVEGYPDLNLFGRHLRVKRHVLIWTAFNIGKAVELPEDTEWDIHHSDKDKENYAVDNLIAMPESIHREWHRREKLERRNKNGKIN